MTPGPSSSSRSRKLTILHFNDVYNISAGAQEPVGGAARFVAAIRQQAAQAAAADGGHAPLVLFSGDALSPSLMSISTLGKQMVPVLAACGVSAACVGNHDLDFGLENFM
jgi:5'-nucleotidase